VNWQKQVYQKKPDRRFLYLKRREFGKISPVARMTYTGNMKKHHPGNLHQISNTEWWYHNVQFGGNVLFRR